MCGITGIIANREIDNMKQRISKMVDSLHHRGPNFRNHCIINNKTALGHTRLSIIDISPLSNQPMISNSGRYSIVFNGEIFNYIEIKKQLQYDFKSNGDTEVVLAGIELYGIEWILREINGMFAFAVYDSKENKTYLIRDRFGIKPLYYTIANDVLIFGSEIKAILNSGLLEPEFNSDAIDEYLGNRSVREPYTFFKNIFQVRSSEYLIFDNKLSATCHQYYHLPAQNFDTEYDEKTLIEQTKVKVEEVVKRWLVADVKVGAYLSGGVDSSLTTAIMANNMQDARQLHTYTIGFEEDNEFEYAKIVADRYHLQHKSILMNYANYIEEWKRLIYYNDAPLGVPNEIPLARMSSELSKNITVVISGEGADELFGGYGRIYRLPFDWENNKMKKSFYDTFVSQYEYVPRAIRDDVLAVEKPLRTCFDDTLSHNFTKYRNEENILRFFLKYHISGLLHRVDMTTMQTSVEARPPFLDHELIDFVSSTIPYDLKLKWNSESDKKQARWENAKLYSEIRDTPKYILKKIAENYLPHEIIYRKKVGFPVPLTLWFSELQKLVSEYLYNADWLHKNCLEELIYDIKQSERAGQILWMFLNVEIFRKQYFNKKWRY
jgi:asparagine synthase (glutamine-hydrolysing)